MVFLICPVRGINEETKIKISEYVESIEQTGKKVYWPLRDTDQNDSIGNKICAANRIAITKAEEVHIWWSDNSQGSIFDLGMAWALNKQLVIANTVEETQCKSFANVIRWWSKRTSD